jgi:hypothetical protein
MDPVGLASTCPMPPVLSRVSHGEATPAKAMGSVQQTWNNPTGPVAPYQAMPVITQSKNTALPVIEPEEHISEQVQDAGLSLVSLERR